MAEFVDVLKIARRMCESIDKCGDCPLMDASTELCYLDKCPKEYNDKDFIRHEAAIMKWAAEHPNPRNRNIRRGGSGSRRISLTKVAQFVPAST